VSVHKRYIFSRKGAKHTKKNVSIQLAIETKIERHLLEHFATENTENTEK